MRHVDMVIVSWAKNDELLQDTKNGLDTLFDSEDENVIKFHAYIIESNPEINYDEYNDTVTIHPTEEFGYHKYLNIGRRAGNSEFVVLCNADLTYEKNWAYEIIKVMDAYPKFLSASPWCPQLVDLPGAIFCRLRQFPHKLGHVYEGYKINRTLAGWCIFQQRKIYDIIKELDENFTFWFCDNDYSMEIQKNNISHCLVCNSVVNHNQRKTVSSLSRDDIYKKTYSQIETFNKKWPNKFGVRRFGGNELTGVSTHRERWDEPCKIKKYFIPVKNKKL